MRHPSRTILASAALAILASACGGGDEALGGFGAPAAAPHEFQVPDTTAMAGTVEVDSRGCWRLEGDGDGALVILPTGFQLGASGDELRTATGQALPSGTPVTVAGARVAVAALPGGPDGKWGNYTAFCDPEAAVVVVAERLEVDG